MKTITININGTVIEATQREVSDIIACLDKGQKNGDITYSLKAELIQAINKGN